MTDVTENRGRAEAELSAADEQLLRELTERARTGGLRLTGEGGLLGRLTKMVIESALEGELDDHLGYGKHDPEGASSRGTVQVRLTAARPRIEISADGTGSICQAGTVLLQTLRVTGLDRGLSRALGGGGYCGRCMTGGRSSRTWPSRLRWAGTSWPISRSCAPSRS